MILRTKGLMSAGGDHHRMTIRPVQQQLHVSIVLVSGRLSRMPMLLGLLVIFAAATACGGGGGSAMSSVEAFVPVLSTKKSTVGQRGVFATQQLRRKDRFGWWFVVPHQQKRQQQRQQQQNSRRGSSRILLTRYMRDRDDDEEEDEDLLLSTEDDWRAFRAKLVMGESKTKTTTAAASASTSTSSSSDPTSSSTIIEDTGDLDGIGSLFAQELSTLSSATTATAVPTSSGGAATTSLTPLDPSQWAYDSGKVIEQGAVILGGVEQDYGFGLRQQYFHKAAILVLDHEESTFTKGIILNRPTDLTLADDVNPNVQWRVWFGGDVQGLDSANPHIVCLHSLKNERVQRASIPVMKDIQWTSFENAKQLVKVGVAKPTDFWVFCGYAGWGSGQLMGELDRKSWYMVATDSQTLLKELARLGAGADPRDAGLDTWTLLMNMIGRGETAQQRTGDFDDLMLKEWARQHLLSTPGGGGGGSQVRTPDALGILKNWVERKEMLDEDPVVLKKVTAESLQQKVTAGTLLRAAPSDRSPFLLENQGLHKSVVLVIKDDEQMTIGVILNRPSKQGLDIQITATELGTSRKITLPLRFGGEYAVKGGEPLLWLHCKSVLRAAKIGSPLSATEKNGIWKCSSNDMIAAVSQGLAKPEDFVIVSGVSVWPKRRGLGSGLQGEVLSGRFQVIPSDNLDAVWNLLKQQELLTKSNLKETIAKSNAAWQAGAPKSSGSVAGEKTRKNGANSSAPPPIGGLGEGFDEDDDALVFKSDVSVSQLSDDALQSWIATFLLQDPTLGQS